MAGLPTIVVVYLAQPAPGDPAVAAVGLLAGAVVAVIVLSRIPKSGHRTPIAGDVAYVHAGMMAAAVGVTTLDVIALDVPHGYWIPMTMTMVLRPVGSETRRIAYQRIAGTVLGAVLAIERVGNAPRCRGRSRDRDRARARGGAARLDGVGGTGCGLTPGHPAGRRRWTTAL